MMHLQNSCVLVRAPTAEIKHNLRMKGGIWLTCTEHSLSLREVQAATQGRNLEAGTEAEAMEISAYWIAPWTVFILLSYITQEQ